MIILVFSWDINDYNEKSAVDGIFKPVTLLRIALAQQ
jgi:hypothetical protein